MDFNAFEEKLGTWAEKLRPFIESPEMDKIYAKLKEDSQSGKVICPKSIDTFRAFKHTNYRKLKVVFCLQDPYPWVKNDVMVADGIAMSCSHTPMFPQPSLIKFYDGIEEDLNNGLSLKNFRDPDLKGLCEQGCMMINTSLTVEKDKVSSHYELWKPFTRYFFEDVLNKCPNGLIFILAGEKSQYYERYINPLQHFIFKVEHPAAAAHRERKWEHQNIFSKTNRLLKENLGTEIIWWDDLPF